MDIKDQSVSMLEFCKDSPPGWQMAAFPLCSYMVEQESNQALNISSYKSTNFIMRALFL